MAKEKKITKQYYHDSMRFKVQFPSGASLMYRVGRSSEKLELAFSNDTTELKKQTQLVNEWLKMGPKETVKDVFDRLEKTCLKVNSGKEFIEAIK